MRRALLLYLLVTIVAPVLPAMADADPDTTSSGFSFSGYGTLRYDNFDWETDTGRRTSVDTEQLTVYANWALSPSITAKSEIEIEHGGTGVAVEFDRFEEFGEFEYEVEKGGEVLLEQLHVEFAFGSAMALKAGRLKVPFGLAAVNDEPTEYPGLNPGEAEQALVPVNWYENGLQLLWSTPGDAVTATLSLVNGLDSSGFSSGTWIVRGQQLRFETINAEDLALATRLDVRPVEELSVGVSAYYGDSADNRPKPDLDVDAHVGIVEGHVEWGTGALSVRGLGMYGHLENADAVSRANRNLSNNLNVKRTPVGSEATSGFLEAALDLDPILSIGHSLVFFGRYDRYDTMAGVTGDVFDNPRWERETFTFGGNYRPTPAVIIKAQYATRTIGIPEDNIENTFSTGIGFEFGEED